MKLKFFLLLFLIFFQGYTQVSVGPKHTGKSANFKKGILEKFKKTKTIFVLSDIYEKDIYEQIIKDSWSVTSYEIVKFEDFRLEDYLSAAYSIAEISGKITVKDLKYGGTVAKLFTFFDFKMYDYQTILEKKKKLSPKKWNYRKEKILDENSLKIARFYLHPKDDFLNVVNPNYKSSESAFIIKTTVLDTPEYMNDVMDAMYSKNVFYNYKPGFLKNYFQKINSQIEREQTYWMYENDYLPEIKKLTKNKLYIPSYITVRYNILTQEDSEKEDEEIHQIFKNYDYQYEIISEDDLNHRILDNQELYYLRYVRTNGEKFLQVINSLTGEIVYRGYITGLSYKLKSKHIKEFNNSIKKALKK